MTLLELFFIAAVIFITLKLISFVFKRTKLLISVLCLERLSGVEVNIESFARFFSPRVLPNPVCRVSVYGKIYSVRLYNGKGPLYAVHIVNERYSAVFMKSGGAVKARSFGRRVVRISESSRVYFPRTVILPKLPCNNDEIPILIFNPAPRELTYVTSERNSIKVAFTGDEINGVKIFTKSTFLNFIDRDTRGFYDGIKNDIYDYDA